MISKDEVKKLDSLAYKIFCEEHRKCFMCPSMAIEEHHLFKREAYIIRWDKRNRIPVCRECHRYIEDIENKTLKEKYISTYGQEQYDELSRLNRLIKPPIYFEYWESKLKGLK